jgi:hypothetical protein
MYIQEICESFVIICRLTNIDTTRREEHIFLLHQTLFEEQYTDCTVRDLVL